MKRNEVQPGKVSVTPTSVQKAMSSGGSGTTEVMAHPWRLVEARAAATGNAWSSVCPSNGRTEWVVSKIPNVFLCKLFFSLFIYFVRVWQVVHVFPRSSCGARRSTVRRSPKRIGRRRPPSGTAVAPRSIGCRCWTTAGRTDGSGTLCTVPLFSEFGH